MVERPLDTTVEVVTPENVAFDYQLAGVARRASAFLLDLGVRLAAWIGLLILAAFLNLPRLLDGGMFMALFLLVLFVSEWFYGAILESYWNGQTVGKRMQGIRVLQINGQPINGLQAVLRNILRTVDMMPVLPLGDLLDDSRESSVFVVPTFLFCLIAMILSRRMQRLGDLVCGTMVVIDQPQMHHAIIKVGQREVLELAADLPPGIHVTRKQARAISSFVARRLGFTEKHRAELARPLANALAEHWSWPIPPDPDIFLCAVYHRVFVADTDDDGVIPASLAESGVGGSKIRPFGATAP